MIATVARYQVVALRRQGVFVSLLAILLAMTALAGVLGWSSHRTIVGVYGEATKLLAAQGLPAPANPFVLKPTLSLLSNMVIYIPLIGALLALVLGHLSIADDESSGVGRLVFSRRIPRSAYLAGKVAGAAGVLAVILAVSLVVSAASLWIVNRTVPTVGELGRLGLFYGLSWMYLMVFALIGMIAVLATGRRPLALLSAMGAWLVITFVVPQFTSGLRPTASLNPIVDPVSTSQTFFKVTSKARPFSVVEQYKAASGRILETAPPESVVHTLARTTPIAGLLIVLAAAAAVLIRHHDFSKGSGRD
jgi:ABC-type transport system involved in multi-copper enzyme maturation permease subunit